MKKYKVPNYPNELFKSVDEYVDFSKKHRVFGNESLALRRRMLEARKMKPWSEIEKKIKKDLKK